MSNGTHRHTQVPCRFHDNRSCRRAVARIFSEKNPPLAHETGVEIYLVLSPRHIIRTTYTRRDLPPPATELPLKQYSFFVKTRDRTNMTRILRISKFEIIITRQVQMCPHKIQEVIYPSKTAIYRKHINLD